MTFKIYLDLSRECTEAKFFVPDRADTASPPDVPIPFGWRRILIEIDVPIPYRTAGLMAYIEEVGEGLIHRPH
jgi:hypothetical protein